MKSNAKYLLISSLMLIVLTGSAYKINGQTQEVIWKKNTQNNIYYDGSGKIGIGTQQPDKELTVNGTIHAEEVIVDLNFSSIPDFVFEDDYNLRSLQEVESFIKTNKHLPEIPSAKEVEANGLNSGEMQAKLLQKVEELTLYVIEMKKENESLRASMNELKKKNGSK